MFGGLSRGGLNNSGISLKPPKVFRYIKEEEEMRSDSLSQSNSNIIPEPVHTQL